MKYRLFASALFKFRNVALFLVFLGIAYLLSDPTAFPAMFRFPPVPDMGLFAYPAAVVLYLALVGQSLLNKDFHEKFNRKQKIRHIQDLNYSCLKLANEAKKYTNATYLTRLRRVMEDKGDIVNSFFKGEQGFLKEKIVEQTLNLVVAYIKLLTNFCIRSRELAGMDVSQLANRINANKRKLDFTKDPIAADDLRKVIEMDERIIERSGEEKRELERTATKLEYMESAINMFKTQVISSIESEEMLEKLETAVNEATALDSVIEDRRRNRMRM